MEFDIEKNKVVGIVDLRLKEDCARIKVIGYINALKKFIIPDESELKELFRPKGFVFEPSFFNNFNFKEGELLVFRIKEIDTSKLKPDGDINRINTDNNNSPKTYGFRVFELKDLYLNNSVVNFSLTKLRDRDEDYSHCFFGISGDKIYGKLKIMNGRIEPEKGHFIRTWDVNKCNLYEYKNHYYLLEDLNDNYGLIDAMDNKDAFKWFKEKLGILNSDVVSYLNNKTNWKNELPDILINQNVDENEVDRIRLRRVCKDIDKHNFLVEDIQELAKTSENLRNAFLSSIELHKIELRSEYATEIEELDKTSKVEKQKREYELTKIEGEIASKNKYLNALSEEINLCNLKIENINSNKDRILSDFAIVQEVLGNINSGVKTSNAQEESFVIESIIPSLGTNPILQKDEFSARLKYYLNQRNLNSSMFGKLISVLSSYKGIFLRDVELGLSFIEAGSNSNYIIQHVEPDWLHFNDLWRNGLEAIWKLSHENPDILHFLILEDVNMSSPECYMRPLLDCMNGIRKQIPFAKTAYPENLRILATKISSDEPKIGLPLYEQTYKNWAAIGFTGNVYKDVEQNHPFVEGYIDAETLSSFKMDEFDLKVNPNRYESEFKKLFDTVE